MVPDPDPTKNTSKVVNQKQRTLPGPTKPGSIPIDPSTVHPGQPGQPLPPVSATLPGATAQPIGRMVSTEYARAQTKFGPAKHGLAPLNLDAGTGRCSQGVDTGESNTIGYVYFTDPIDVSTDPNAPNRGLVSSLGAVGVVEAAMGTLFWYGAEENKPPGYSFVGPFYPPPFDQKPKPLFWIIPN